MESTKYGPGTARSHWCGHCGWRGGPCKNCQQRDLADARPDALATAERAIVRALKDAGLGSQSQVTEADRFEIATDDVIVRVERNPDGDYLRSLRANAR